MCGTCGCGGTAAVTVLDGGGEAAPAHGHGPHPHHHGHGHSHHRHDHGPHDHHHGGHDHDRHDPGRPHHPDYRASGHDAGARARIVEIEARVLARNDALAAQNRAWFSGREVLAVNLVSSPGAGKTALLERTVRTLGRELPLFVLEGDQATTNDAARIRAAGAPVVQINTGAGCHLEADMVARGVRELRPQPGSVVLIENVGNLVCPAMFDLGERAKVVVLSVTEGEDKPLKYPHMFRAAEVMILNKTDLLPHVDFDIGRAVAHAREVNPDIGVLQLSAKSGDGFEAWYGWLRRERAAARAAVWTPGHR